MKRSTLLPLLILTLFASAPVRGTETAFWQTGSFDEFLQGTPTNVSLDTRGALRLAPDSQVVFSPDEALAVSLARDHRGNLYVGTAHQGKVFRVDSKQNSALLFTAPEPDIFAMAAGPDGSLYVGSSPEGKVYRVAADGKSSVFYDPHAKYIWALAFDAQRRLYVATGDKGQIFRIDPAGKAEVFFDSKQTHIMCLAFDKDGNLLAGSVPNGLVYRITPQAKAFVIYDSGLPEIHDLATDSDGRIYAAALGSAGGKGSPDLLMGPSPAVIQEGVTTVTVMASSGTAGLKVQNAPAMASPAPGSNRPAVITTGMPGFQIPQGRGSLVQILPDSTAETIWSSNNESIFGLAVRDHHVLFSTDSHGRIFDVFPGAENRSATLLTETHESLATRMVLEGTELYVATSNVAKLLRVGKSLSREGTYESPVKDAKFISKWGVLTWRGEVPPGCRIEFETRSGNSERPDQTWSDWATLAGRSSELRIPSIPTRFMQWKAMLHADETGTNSPTLAEVTVSYLNQNLPPEIHSLNVSTAGEQTSLVGGNPPGLAAGAGMMGVPQAALTFGPMPAPSVAAGKIPVTLSWQADDPNNDQLVYSLYVRATDEREWRLLKDKLRQTNYTIEPNALPDGKYIAKLVASDEVSNPPASARKSELLSVPFWIANTPPAIRVMGTTLGAEGGEVRFEARDSTSPLRSAETSTDGADWKALLSDDGIIDSQAETFTVKLSRLEPGEHVVALRVSDVAGNTGVGKAVVHIPPK